MATSDADSIYTDVTSLAPYDEADEDDGDSLLYVSRFVDDTSGSHSQNDANKTAEQARKALEAAEEAQGAEVPTLSTTPTRPSSTRSIGGWSGVDYERTPLLDAGPAPPDYSQATAYRTFAQPGAFRRRGHDASSTLISEDGRNGLDSTSKASSREKLRKFVHNNWKLLCLLNLAIFALLATSVLIIRQITSGLASNIHSPYYPEHPEYANSAAFQYPEKQAQYHMSTSECAFNDYFLRGYGGFYDSTFSLIESMEPSQDSEFGDFLVSGNIEVRPAPYSQVYAVDVWMSFATTEGWRMTEPVSEWTPDGVRYRFPELERMENSTNRAKQVRGVRTTNHAKRPCLDVWIGVYVKHTLENFKISSDHANVDISYPKSFNSDGNWWFMVHNNTKISTKIGNISASFLTSAHVDLSATSGSITGNYSFDKDINFTTTSGDIDVLINQSAQRVRHRPTTHLTSTTGSGNTRVSLNHETWFEDQVPRMEQYDLQAKHRSDDGKIELNYAGWGAS